MIDMSRIDKIFKGRCDGSTKCVYCVEVKKQVIELMMDMSKNNREVV